MDDEGDEDFAPPQRRTPYSTPAKPSRLGRPGSAHATPRRSGSRGGAGAAALAGASPGALGLRGLSPYVYHLGVSPLEGGGDLMSDLGLADLSYLTSPGGGWRWMVGLRAAQAWAPAWSASAAAEARSGSSCAPF